MKKINCPNYSSEARISSKKEIKNLLPTSQTGDRGDTVVTSEGRWFDSRWCHWNFSLT